MKAGETVVQGECPRVAAFLGRYPFSHHVEDRLLPLEQTAHHPLDSPLSVRVDAVRGSALVLVTNRRGDAAGAARFLGASEAVREATGYEFEPGEQNLLAKITEEMGNALEVPSVRAAYEDGRAIDPDGARALAQSQA
jgi:hypothetical protein